MKNFLQPQPFHYEIVEFESGKTMTLSHPYTRTKWLSPNAWLIILGVILIIMAFLPKEYTNELLRLVALCEFLYLATLRDEIDAYERCMKDIRKQAP